MKKLSIILFTCLLTTGGLEAQSIRKPWREMTYHEVSSFINAVNTISASFVTNMANEHNRLALMFGQNDHIHNSNIFLPWHRVFLLHLEAELKKNNPNISLPYWDWTDDWGSSATVFRNNSNGNDGLFIRSIFSSVWQDPRFNNSKFTRSFDNSLSQPTQPQLENIVNIPLSEFTRHRQDLEGGPHNIGHRMIGGTMATMFSPADPIFYLHHCMVDKVWNDWVETNWAGGILPFSSSDPDGSNSSMLTFVGYGGSTNANNVVRVNPNSWVDSRNTKVWYAHNGKVVLNDYTTSGTEDYRYAGTIELEDFIVNSTTDVLSGSTIVMKPGFEVANGKSFHAYIDNSAFNTAGARIATSDEKMEEDNYSDSAQLNEIGIKYEEQTQGLNIYGISSSLETGTGINISIYPNPTSGEFALEFSDEGEWDIQIVDLMGKTIDFESFRLSNRKYMVKLEKLSSGIYNIILQTPEGFIQYKKIIIKR